MKKEEVIKNLEEKVSDHYGVRVGSLCSRASLALGGYPFDSLIWLGFGTSITSNEGYECLDMKFLDLSTGEILTEGCWYNGNFILIIVSGDFTEDLQESVIRYVRSKVIWIRYE